MRVMSPLFAFSQSSKRKKLASFKEEQPPYRSNAASHVGAAVSAHVDERSLSQLML